MVAIRLLETLLHSRSEHHILARLSLFPTTFSPVASLGAQPSGVNRSTAVLVPIRRGESRNRALHCPGFESLSAVWRRGYVVPLCSFGAYRDVELVLTIRHARRLKVGIPFELEGQLRLQDTEGRGRKGEAVKVAGSSLDMKQ